MINTNIFCEHPKLIFNQTIYRAIHENGNYFFDDFCRVVKSSVSANWVYSKPRIFPPASKLTIDQASKYYTVSSDGVITYAYMMVPCNHCNLCNELARNDWSQRAMLEAQMYDFPPMFFTLTYNNTNLPGDGVSKREMQLFFKKMRHLVPSFRYMCCGEYGHKHHRPHYHIIFFSNTDYKLFDEAVRKVWVKGFIQSKRLTTENGNAYSYCAKYLKKSEDNRTSADQNPPFFLSSRGNGGLGFQKFKEFIPQIKANKVYNRNLLCYLDKFSGKIFKFRLNSYFFRKVFPSVARMVDYRFRVAYNTLMVLANDLEQPQDIRYKWQEFLSNFPQIPLCVPCMNLNKYQIECYIQRHKHFSVYQAIKDIQKRWFRVPSVEYVEHCQRQRERYMASMPQRVCSDLVHVISSLARQRQIENECDIF